MHKAGFDTYIPPPQTGAARLAYFCINGPGDRVRTYDLTAPNGALYQTELHSDITKLPMNNAVAVSTHNITLFGFVVEDLSAA